MSRARAVVIIPIGGNRTVMLSKVRAKLVMLAEEEIRSFAETGSIVTGKLVNVAMKIDRNHAEPLLTVGLYERNPFTFGKRRAKAFIENIETIRRFVENIESATAERKE